MRNPMTSLCNNEEVLALNVGDRLTTPVSKWNVMRGKNPATGKWEELPGGKRVTIIAIRDSGLNKGWDGLKGDLYVDAMTDDGFRIGNVLAISFFQE